MTTIIPRPRRSDRRWARRLGLPGLLCSAGIILAACAGPAPDPRVVTQRVEVPVAVTRTPPPELLSAALPAFPEVVFVPAGSPDAAIGVTPAGRDALVGAIAKAKSIIAAWRAWAGAEYSRNP